MGTKPKTMELWFTTSMGKTMVICRKLLDIDLLRKRPWYYTKKKTKLQLNQGSIPKTLELFKQL